MSWTTSCAELSISLSPSPPLSIPLSPWSADLEVAVHYGGSLCVHVGHGGADLVEHSQHVPRAQTNTVHHILQLAP